jgi:hypothetical protein
MDSIGSSTPDGGEALSVIGALFDLAGDPVRAGLA